MFGLTAQQERADGFDDGNLLIVAGAGTGKTTTLSARLASLVRSGVPAERILLLTFSRRAAVELLHRAEQLAGAEVAASTWGCTFHAIANRLLRRHGRALGLEPSFTVLDTADTADLLALVREEAAADDAPERRRRSRKETMAAILSRCVNAGAPLSEVLQRHFPWCVSERDELRAAFAAYLERKRSTDVLDFDDLLLFWRALLDQPQAAAAIQRQFDHVLVDEYQDTNALQADVLEGMCAGGATITAVGDDAQAIYSFRAATVRNILDFPTRFAASLVTLDQSHRSTRPLLTATNAVIAEAAERHPKDLWSDRAGDERPTLLRCPDEGAEARLACERILDHHERGTALRQQAVLVRTGHHSDLLEVELTVRNMPFVKYGGLRFLETAHVKDLVALLRLVENPRDELPWYRALQLLDGVGPATARRLSRRVVGEGPGVLAGQLPGAEELVEVLAEARRHPGAPGVQAELAVRWLGPVVERRYPKAASRQADLDQFEQAAGGAASLERFLTELSLDPPASTGDLAGPPQRDDDFLTISTVHSAKGLEWDVVHVLRATDGCIPSDMATGDAEAVEEERRLLYVAMTRARTSLHLYAPVRYHHRPTGRDDAHGRSHLSRFLTPTVRAHLHEVDVTRRSRAEPGPVPLDGRRGAGVAAVDRLVTSLLD
ncbi:ATP-dependent helicase [soil metagenome]